MSFQIPPAMKWHGWGHPQQIFPMEDKPRLWPFIEQKLGLKKDHLVPPVSLDTIELPQSKLSPKAYQSLQLICEADRMSQDHFQRLVHSFGKSYPDLYRARQGLVTSCPDLVIWPRDHDHVQQIIAWALEHDVVLIPFGGGTNIVNALELKVQTPRAMVSLDLRAMKRLLKLEAQSNLAHFEAGVTGPELEAQLAQQGFSLGHFPDSFEFSTLGGWIATRSAGMQSDAYGRIEDMVQSLRVLTAKSELDLKPFPASSAGPDLNQLFIGSEGHYGVITQAWMRVHPIPAMKLYEGYLFPSFAEGLAAVQACYRKAVHPALIRLQDEGETELAMHLKSPSTGLKAWVEKPVKSYLKHKGYHQPALMVVGFEGPTARVQADSDQVKKIFRSYRGFSLGPSIGDSWSKDKYNTPYLRDTIMDFGGVADVAETSASWSELFPLYQQVINEIESAAQSEGVSCYHGCHLSHTYSTGGCLYFTWAVEGGEIPLDRYYRFKTRITDRIVQSGGTLSHHHAVGKEHLPWLAQEIGQEGMQVLQSLKKVLDPQDIFNPGSFSNPS